MPVTVFYGEETFLLEQAVSRLRQQVVHPAMASLSHRVYSRPSLAGILEAVGSVSMALGGQTLIEIREFTWLAQAAKDPSTEAQLDELKTLLETLEPHKVVLFTATKLDIRLKFPKWLTRQPDVTVQKFEPFKFWEATKVVDFTLHHAQENGIPLMPEAAQLLVDLLGTDLRLLTNEIRKLSLYALDRPITAEDVRKLSLHRDNVFLLVNRWILRQAPQSNFEELHAMLLRRHPVELFATIQGYFNNLFRAIWLHAQGLSPEAIATRTGQKPFSIRKNLAQFQSVPLTRWTALKHALVQHEWQAKTGQLEGSLALETLLAR